MLQNKLKINLKYIIMKNGEEISLTKRIFGMEGIRVSRALCKSFDEKEDLLKKTTKKVKMRECDNSVIDTEAKSISSTKEI